MRRYVSVAMVLCLCLLISTGCSSNPEKTVSFNGLKYFEFSSDDVYNFLNEKMTSYKDKGLVSRDIETEKIPEYGEVNCRIYNFPNGGSISLYESPVDEKLLKIVLLADIDMLDANGIDEFTFGMEQMLIMIEESKLNGHLINEELNLGNIIMSITTSANGEIGHYTYDVSREHVMLTITPLLGIKVF